MNTLIEKNIEGVWSFTPLNGEKTYINVPGGGWLKQGFFCEAGTYETTITIPNAGQPQVTMLELGAVNHLALYYIGKPGEKMEKIHEEVTAFTEQKVDLTKHVIPGETYVLKIFVRAWEEGHPIAPHWAEWCKWIARGIFRYGRIRVYPQIYISDVFIKTYVGVKDKDLLWESSIKYQVQITNASKNDFYLLLRGNLKSWNGKDFSYPELPDEKFSIRGEEVKTITIGPVPWTLGSDSWWWPNIPYKEGYRAKLHILNIEIVKNQNILHSASIRFGFREIVQRGNHYELNGIRINFRGDNLQVANYDEIDYGGKGDAIDTYPGFLPPSDKNPGWPKAVDNFLRLNFNVQREHMGPWTPYMIDLCDEMGLMLIGESACRWEGFDMKDGRGFNEVKCLKDIVKRDKNHPSIIRWSIKNEPQCLEPEYHLELYQAVKSIDDTRPLSEDIATFNRNKFDTEKVFLYLLNKPDYTWIEHYITYDPEGKPSFSIVNHNDGVVPMEERPYGLGEANWMRSSTHSGLTWFATTIVLARMQGASDVRPYVLLSGWASSIPGVKTKDFMLEENRYPVYGEDNLPEPWDHWKIKLLQKASSPVLAIDTDFWKINGKSDAWGHFPTIAPKVKANSRVVREIMIFNDELTELNAELHWDIREGSTSNRPLDSGKIGVFLEPGNLCKGNISFDTPIFNTYIFLTLIIKREREELFRDDLTCYQVIDGEDLRPVLNDEERKFI